MRNPISQSGKFDFVEAAAQSYRFVWEKRAILAQLALLPFLIKTVLFIAIVILGLDDNYLRAGLLLLPSYVAEGWLAAQAIRLAIMLNPKRFGNVPLHSAMYGNPNDYRKTLLASIILYALIKLVTAFIAGMLGTLEAMTPEQAPPAPISPMLGVMVAFAGIGLMIWSFRYIWLYVPVAMGYSLRAFLRRIRNLMASFYLISLWLMCFIPLILLVLILSEILIAVFPMASEQEFSAAFTYAMVFVQAATEILVCVIASVAFAFAAHSIMEGKTESFKQP